jgi:heme/copper-type cytochrome/quinol oxidase subunit 2
MTHTPVPDSTTEAKDQQEFDEAVNRTGKVVLEWLAGVGIVAALMMSMVALVKSGEKTEVVSGTPTATLHQAGSTTTVSAASTAAAKPVSLKIVGSYKKGPDGKLHDAFTQTEFAVKVGQPVKLTIDNTDDVPHSITSPVANVNIVSMPGTHTYTLTVSKAGKFEWYCMYPCDTDTNGWAMTHPGFMSGYITAS